MTATLGGVDAAAVAYGDARVADAAVVSQAALDQAQAALAALQVQLHAEQQLDATKDAQIVALQQTIVDLQKQLSPQPPPSQFGTALGASLNGGSAVTAKATLAAWPWLKAFRVYQSGPAVPWQQDDQLPLLPAGRAVIVSAKESMGSILSGASDARLIAQYDSLPTDRDITSVIWHEPSNDGIPAAQYVSAQSYWADLIHKHCAIKSNVHLGQILIAQAATDDWYVPKLDRWGFDSYFTTTFATCVGRAKKYGKPYVIGEFGKADPATALTVAKQMHDAMAQYPPEVACWFNGTVGGDFLLADHKDVASYLQSVA